MLELGKPIHTFDAGAVARARRAGHDRRAARAAGRAPRDAGPRRARPHARHAGDRRPDGPDRHRRRHGRRDDARSATGRPTSSIESAIFDPVEHPADGPAARAPLRGEPAGSRRARSRGWRASAPTGPRSWSASGRAARSRPGASTPRPTSPAARASRSGPARVNRLLGTELPADEQRELLARVGIETEAARRRRRSSSRCEPEPLVVEPGGRPGEVARSPRSCPPGAATSRSRPTSPRRSRASAATS